jgi:para-aminobenzoate synthetase component I
MPVQTFNMPKNFYSRILDRVGASRVGIVFGGGQKEQIIVALQFSEIDPEKVAKICLKNARSTLGGMPPQAGIFGVMSYDDMATKKVVQSRFFALHKFLVIDQRANQYVLVDNGEGASEFDCSQVLHECEGDPSREATLTPMTLLADDDDGEYLEKVKRVLSDIRAGRFYQLNLIRQFRLPSVTTSSELAQRYLQYSGNQGSWVKIPGLEIISFSPETFVTYQREGGESVLSAWPIKGTIARGADRTSDAVQRQALLNSKKDDAELSIIVDLMRNDLNMICRRGSVRVAMAKSLKTTETVHHLEAKISGRLEEPVTLIDLFNALGPCGSITGAPKKEVMRAIAELESRPRGFFMGSAFFYDAVQGLLDSSILIRTIVNADGNYRYAAGSGIVVSSSPQNELDEVKAKCAILTKASPNFVSDEQERIRAI